MYEDFFKKTSLNIMKNTLLLFASTMAISSAAVITTATYTNNAGSGAIFADGVQVGTFTVTTPYSSTLSSTGDGVEFFGAQVGTSNSTTVDVTITDGNFSFVSMTWGTHEGTGGQGIGGGTIMGVALDTDATVSTSVGSWDIGGAAITTPVAYTAGEVLTTAGIVSSPHSRDSFLFTGATATTQTITYTTDSLDLAQERYYVSFELDAIPEPSSAALLGLGGLALVARRKRVKP